MLLASLSRGAWWMTQPFSEPGEFNFKCLPWYMTCLANHDPRFSSWQKPLKLRLHKSLKLGLIEDLHSIWVIFHHLTMVENCQCHAMRLEPGDLGITTLTIQPPVVASDEIFPSGSRLTWHKKRRLRKIQTNSCKYQNIAIAYDTENLSNKNSGKMVNTE